MPLHRRAIHDRAGVRKAYASKGDDVTFSRFVKTGAPRIADKAKPRQLVLATRHRAFEEGRTLFRKTVKTPDEVKTVLVSGHSNVKIGRDVRKGRLFRGYWIYTLSLEERATCPETCHHWQTCYGNNMPWAKRLDHRDRRALYAAIEADLDRLCAIRGREGVLVRLHALGDFFDVGYVGFWLDQLARRENLAVFGYTARKPSSDIGRAIARVKAMYGRRFAIRWSDGKAAEDCTVSIREPGACPPDAFVCPEQTGKVAGCGKCGLCWNSTRNVAFVEH